MQPRPISVAFHLCSLIHREVRYIHPETYRPANGMGTTFSIIMLCTIEFYLFIYIYNKTI